MLLIRRFEEKTAEMYQRAKIGGYCHLNLGEEATCVGLCAGMQPNDYLFTNYREHGYALARGIDPGRVMAELFGRDGGVSRGRGGSMHLFDLEKRLMGGYAIVGGQLPLATGAGLAIARTRPTPTPWCARWATRRPTSAPSTSRSTWPRCGSCRSSTWSSTTASAWAPRSRPARRSPTLHEKACAYGMPGVRVDGNDVLAVRDAVREAVERARTERMPSADEHQELPPARATRWSTRTAIAREDYLKEIRAQDPLALLAERLKDERRRRRRRAGARSTKRSSARSTAAVEFADESPEPNPTKLFEFSYATEVANQPVGSARPGSMGVVTYRQALHDTLAKRCAATAVVLLGEEIGNSRARTRSPPGC